VRGEEEEEEEEEELFCDQKTCKRVQATEAKGGWGRQTPGKTESF